MPTALVLTLRPAEATTAGAYLGRASHAALLRAIAARDAGLAQQLHDSDGVKPLAASDLLDAPGNRDGRPVTPDQTYRLRWCGLSRELDALLTALAAEPPPEIDLDGAIFHVERATTDSAADPCAGAAGWPELVALERIGRESPPSRFTLHFQAPTTFRSSGRSLPLPLPELIFGSLLDRWNAIAPITLPPEVRRFAAECLALGRYELRSVHVPVAGSGETAFVGRCTLAATNRDRYYLHCCAALLRLAFWSGVGAKTGMGFGQVRVEAMRQQPRSRGVSAPDAAAE